MFFYSFAPMFLASMPPCSARNISVLTLARGWPPFGRAGEFGKIQSKALPVFIGEDSFGTSHDWFLSPIKPVALKPKGRHLKSSQTDLWLCTILVESGGRGSCRAVEQSVSLGFTARQ